MPDIAYIEDDADLRVLLVERLSQAGYRCEPYESAEAFLPNAQPGRYDAIVLDIQLPGMSGVQLLKRLREAGIFTPAVLITAFNTRDVSRDALNASANFLLEKPFSFDELRRLLDRIVAQPSSLQDCVDRGLARLHLSRREEEIARLALKGLSNKEIGDIAAIGEQTVKQHLAQVFEKASVRSRGEFFAYIFPA